MLQHVPFSLMTLLILGSNSVYAQSADIVKPTSEIVVEGGETDRVTVEKKTRLDFEDELIEGTAQKPDLFYMFQKNNFKFKKLIKLRENFLPEMSQNAEDIQRLRGGR